MAQNGFSRRSSSATRTYPGTAARLLNSPLNGTSGGSVPAVFVRPLSRSQLTPIHVASTGQESTNSQLAARPPSPAPRPISLDQPRPNSERNRNLYLGAPVSHRGSPGNCSKQRVDLSVTAAEQVRLPSNSRTKKGHSDSSSQSSVVVTTQPTKKTLLDSSSSGVDSGGKGKLAESSIVCPYCRKCRCEACATPRPLPSRWVCSKSVHCGPEPLLDYVTCLCCVKAVFYHCGKDHEADGGVMCADRPCSCAPHRKFWRWGCMGAMSLVLPCLCLYLPCKGCIRLVEKAYQRYHNNGCTCRSSTCGVSSRDGCVDSSEEEDSHISSSPSHLRGTNHFSQATGIPLPADPARTGSGKLLSLT